MMMGAFKGACVCKDVIPYSRVPGLILSCSVIFSFGFLLLILIVITQLIGNGIMRLAFTSFIAASCIYLPWEYTYPKYTFRAPWILLAPCSTEEAASAIDRRQYIALFGQLLMVFFLIWWLFSFG